MSDSPLIRALRDAKNPSRDYSDALKNHTEYEVSDAHDARAVAEALESLDRDNLPSKNSLQTLLAFLQRAASQEAFDILARDALPIVLDIFDRGKIDDDSKLFFLKIFALYLDRRGVERIIHAARAPLQPTAYMWSVIFQALAPAHPLTLKIVSALANPLPPDFIGIAFLDLANLISAEKTISDHPFNSAEGIARLHGFLTSTDARQYSYANSAAAASPFLKNPARDELMPLAMNHPDAGVKMCAAWAGAKLGNISAVNLLSKMCLDPRHSQTAWGYLENLNRQEMIPIEAQRPDFRAIAEMCNWLSHPMEHGRPPDEIEVYDSREMNWPPTNDRRRLWLLKFKYRAATPDKPDTLSIGMVGSMTFSLSTTQETPRASAEDIYALHCCWELKRKKDPRAPKDISIEAGRGILKL